MGTTVEANNINIWYEEFGDRSNETILLIMGANANCMQWDEEFIDRLVVFLMTFKILLYIIKIKKGI